LPLRVPAASQQELVLWLRVLQAPLAGEQQKPAALTVARP
jgi:hypothetical protein